ncbi:site-2 protease family protein [Flexithrix dorotheae]|uniref:site-2 protease family protein n=1 Tax=Flexithrix dorotheae TaxID=70993 RepID=UPI00036CA7A8|nr:site-2 protease family protein [Flexithrix dorotheae]
MEDQENQSYEEEEYFDPFPPKPELEEEQENPNSLAKSVLSVVIFIAAFYLIFDMDLIFILILVGVLFIHEMGHFLAMKIFGYNDVKMFFIPLLGAMVTGDKKQISQFQRSIVLLAGPVPGIIIGLAIWYFAKDIPDNNYLIEIANIFIFLNGFNLLPFSPLDGGNLIETLFFNSSQKIQTVFLGISAFVFTAFAIYSENYILVIIPVFIVTRINYQRKTIKIRKALSKEGIDYQKNYEELSNKEYWLIRDEMLRNSAPLFPNIRPEVYRASPVEDKILTQVQLILQKPPILDLSFWGKTVLIFVWILFFLGPIVGFSLLVY